MTRLNIKNGKVIERIFKLGDDISEGFTPGYIKYFLNTTFLGLHVHKKHLVMQLRVDENKFKDQKNMAKDISSRKWTVTREIKIAKIEEMEYALGLIKQAYESQ